MSTDRKASRLVVGPSATLNEPNHQRSTKPPPTENIRNMPTSMDLGSMLNESAMGGQEDEESPEPSATTAAVHTPISTPYVGDASASNSIHRTSRSDSPMTNPRGKAPWSRDGFALPPNTWAVTSVLPVRPYHESAPLDGSFAINEARVKAYEAVRKATSPLPSQCHTFSDSKGSLSSDPGGSSNSSANHSRVSSLSTAAERHMSDQQDHSYGSSTVPEDMHRMPTSHDRQSSLDMPTSVSHYYSPGGGVLLQPDPFAPSHRRAISAPDLPGIAHINLSGLPTLSGLPPPNHMQQSLSTLGQENQVINSQEPLASCERQHQACQARSSPTRSRSPSPDNFDLGGPMPPFDPDEVPTESTCMLVENCTTDSTHRKAISHIFGRNKLCTRQIPQPIWVHFCRKHYQRVRYRNVDDYAKLQIEMVLRQLDRLQAWSRKNQREGKPGVVENWSLNTRKREKQRIASGGQPDEVGKKRVRQEDTPEDDQDEDDTPPIHWLDHQQRKKGTTLPHAVPEWLLAKCGNGYSTAEVRAIMVELQEAIVRGDLTQIPDIELLPNITTDPAEENKPAKYRRRNNTDHTADVGPHKRSQSYDAFPQYGGSPFRPLYGGGHGYGPNVNAWGSQSQGVYPAPNTSQPWGIGNPYNGAGLGYSVPPRGSERSAPSHPPNGHRPSQSASVPWSNANHAQDLRNIAIQSKAEQSIASYGTSVLPAPVAQRPGAQPVAQQLGQQMEDPLYKSQRPCFQAHQKAQSDLPSYRSAQQSSYDARSRYGTHYDTPRYQAHVGPWQDRADQGSASGHQQAGSPSTSTVHLKTEPSHSNGTSIYPPTPTYTTGSQYGAAHDSDNNTEAASHMVLPQPPMYRASNGTSGLSPSQAQEYGHTTPQPRNPYGNGI